MPEFYMILARKMAEFFIIIARKIFSQNFRGGARAPPPRLPPVYAYGRVCCVTDAYSMYIGVLGQVVVRSFIC